MIKKIDNWSLTTSTVLTLMRLALAPVLVYAINEHAWVPALMIFGVACVSDVLDGMLARLWQEETILGRLLDPVADKVLILSTFIALQRVSFFEASIPSWFITFLIFKELILVAGALALGYTFSTNLIKPTMLGKVAMASQSILISILLLSALFHSTSTLISLSVFLVMCLILAAAVEYSLIGIKGIIACILGQNI